MTRYSYITSQNAGSSYIPSNPNPDPNLIPLPDRIETSKTKRLGVSKYYTNRQFTPAALSVFAQVINTLNHEASPESWVAIYNLTRTSRQLFYIFGYSPVALCCDPTPFPYDDRMVRDLMGYPANYFSPPNRAQARYMRHSKKHFPTMGPRIVTSDFKKGDFLFSSQDGYIGRL